MRSLGFVVNRAARDLRSGTSHSIGLVVLDMMNSFFTEVARGVEEAADRADHALIVCNADNSRDKERRCLRMLTEQRVRGILITPVGGDARVVDDLQTAGIPAVLVDSRGRPGDSSVAVDDRRGGELAVAHLLSLGHRRIAYVCGPPGVRQHADRWAGARRACLRAGVNADQALVRLRQPEMGLQAGLRAAEEQLASYRDVTAVFAANDLLAFGVSRRLLRAGLTVPGDVAIVGYDDIELAADWVVPITSVRQPMRDLGGAAVELLLAPPANPRRRRVVFQPELVIRASCGARPMTGLQDVAGNGRRWPTGAPLPTR